MIFVKILLDEFPVRIAVLRHAHRRLSKAEPWIALIQFQCTHCTLHSAREPAAQCKQISAALAPALPRAYSVSYLSRALSDGEQAASYDVLQSTAGDPG